MLFFVLLLSFVFVLLVFGLVASRREVVIYDDFDDEEETVTTTTTTTVESNEPEYVVKGVLKRTVAGTQFFVIDPADGAKIWVNPTDDLYRDANGGVWQMA
jgi:hypothetical protein